MHLLENWLEVLLEFFHDASYRLVSEVTVHYKIVITSMSSAVSGCVYTK